MTLDTGMYIANLAFLLEYTDGTKNNEIEYEMYKVAFQDKETIHYDRSTGGNFRDMEQEKTDLTAVIKFIANFITSVYYVNQKKNNEPYIVVGSEDISMNQEIEDGGGKYTVLIKYRLLQDLTKEGFIKI
jgi:hypothetical protein